MCRYHVVCVVIVVGVVGFVVVDDTVVCVVVGYDGVVIIAIDVVAVCSCAAGCTAVVCSCSGGRVTGDGDDASVFGGGVGVWWCGCW